MIRLKHAHRADRAVVILGGPSLIAQDFDLARLGHRGFVTFLETKALTPLLLQRGFRPDYFLLPFPEKAKDNSVQHFVYRSFLADTRIDGLLRPPYAALPKRLRAEFNKYFESWRPEKGAHKRYRWRPDVYLENSPYHLVEKVPATKILVNRTLIREYFPSFSYDERSFYFDQAVGKVARSAAAYFNPLERDGIPTVYGSAFFNVAAIALYPLLNYMGFRQVYCVGMDMSMLGSMEYAAPYTFRSMAHFWWFFRRTRHAFNANYKANGWLFRRPRSEFDDLRMLWKDAPLTFTRVYEPWRYASPIDGIRTISLQQFEKL